MNETNLLSETGIIITMILISIPVIVAAILITIKANNSLRFLLRKEKLRNLHKQIINLSKEELDALEKRKSELEFQLSNNELAGSALVEDNRGLIGNVINSDEPQFIEQKKKSQYRPAINPALTKLILWFIGMSLIWLLFGTTIGLYLGIKFVSPDIDQLEYLSFGRLRPVHTNVVFWGWASLAMIGLAYYLVPKVSNIRLISIRKGYITLWLLNIAIIVGTITLMLGLNNGGGEYREFIWPVMLMFGAGIVVSLQNFIYAIAKRKTKEIYVSNWYIISAMMFLLVIVVIAYLPFWQDGLGETIIQGYYMHQGVGMWFMLFCLGLMYYFLPQQLNKPIYSYSLGILAFWTQILFYTLIGTHHFIFSAIPWWLQTVAIVGSVGMIIPVVAGTTNFLMTFKGAWNKVSKSYTLPFYIIGIIFYFTGSLQGTAEAFRFTNQVWHFTDFTVAHSHLTMYGIISFMLWGFIYTLVPRLTGKEPSFILVGAHFWFALIGLLMYAVPLMYGSTLKGISWMKGESFIQSVELMAPFWLWRAIGGTLMWISHVLFGINFIRMVRRKKEIHIPKTAIEILQLRKTLLKEHSKI